MPKRTATLTPLEERFAAEYLVDVDGAAAYVRAGGTKRSAKQRASDMMKRPRVKAAVKALMAERAARVELTQDMVVQELRKLGFANMADYIAVDDGGNITLKLSSMTREQAAAVSELVVEEFTERDAKGKPRTVQRIKFKLHDKKGPLVDLGKHLGMFKGELVLSNPDGSPIGGKPAVQVYIPDNGRDVPHV